MKQQSHIRSTGLGERREGLIDFAGLDQVAARLVN
jgi:hypothetical protein